MINLLIHSNYNFLKNKGKYNKGNFPIYLKYLIFFFFYGACCFAYNINAYCMYLLMCGNEQDLVKLRG
jgi:hypothetical protein